jgi:hypothetical protein
MRTERVVDELLVRAMALEYAVESVLCDVRNLGWAQGLLPDELDQCRATERLLETALRLVSETARGLISEAGEHQHGDSFVEAC